MDRWRDGWIDRYRSRLDMYMHYVQLKCSTSEVLLRQSANGSRVLTARGSLGASLYMETEECIVSVTGFMLST